MCKVCDLTENTSNGNLKSVFPRTEAYGIKSRKHPMQIQKNVFFAPSTPPYEVTRVYMASLCQRHVFHHIYSVGAWSDVSGGGRPLRGNLLPWALTAHSKTVGSCSDTIAHIAYERIDELIKIHQISELHLLASLQSQQ